MKSNNSAMPLQKNIVKRKAVQGLVCRTKLLYFALLSLALTANGNPQELNTYSQYVEVISNSDRTINELSAVSECAAINNRLNALFQSFSENKVLAAKIPAKRIQEKTELYKACAANHGNCDYVPEGYVFAINCNFLNLKYQYNAFGSYDLFFKHAVIDLATVRRLLYSDIFTSPEQILEKFNARYVKEIEDYLATISSTDLSEEQQDEYDILKNHLDSRASFRLDDLNNFELFFDPEKQRFTEIRFHYNGSGGVYKTILTAGYIAFTLQELDDLLVKKNCLIKQCGKVCLGQFLPKNGGSRYA